MDGQEINVLEDYISKNKLKITKQSLNRVLRDLIKSKMIKQIQDETDTRKKNHITSKETTTASIFQTK